LTENTESNSLYVAADLYARGKAFRDIAQLLNTTPLFVLHILKENLPPLAYENILIRRRTGELDRLCRIDTNEESENASDSEWEADVLPEDLEKNLGLDGSHKFSLSKPVSQSHGARRARRTFPPWTQDDPEMREMADTYVRGEERVGDIAERFYLLRTDEVLRILRKVFHPVQVEKMKEERRRNVILRGVDPQELADAYTKGDKTIDVLCMDFGFDDPTQVERALLMAFGEARLGEMKEERRLNKGDWKGKPYKWHLENPKVKVLSTEYVAGKKTLDQVAMDYGLARGQHLIYVLKQAFGDEGYRQLREQRALNIQVRRGRPRKSS